MVTASEFIDGTRVRWQALAGAIIGGAFFAYFEGVTRVVLAFARALTSPIDALATFFADVITLITVGGSAVVRGSFLEAARAASEAGPLAFVISVGIALATLYLFGQGVKRIVGF